VLYSLEGEERNLAIEADLPLAAWLTPTTVTDTHWLTCLCYILIIEVAWFTPTSVYGYVYRYTGIPGYRPF
jgi:hypothetical protein